MLVPVRWLFVYGTLMPGRLRWSLVADDVAERRPATVAGTLYDTGRGYPALVPRVPGPAVEGWLLGVDEGLAEGVLDRLDEVEGPEYRRVDVVATDGTAAVTYGWIGLPEGFAVLADGRWHGRDER
jgi:gamma-glutamylcyclotransferase (GGCT)/AIG2-like uncharacterized protein YtfP